MFSLEVPDSSNRIPLTALGAVPLLLLYYAHAILIILPVTRLVRAALLPFTLYCAWHGGTHYNYALTAAPMASKLGYEPERLNYVNFMFAVRGSLLSCRRSYLIRFSDHLHRSCLQSNRMDNRAGPVSQIRPASGR